MAISKRLRHEVMKRDNFTCRYCRSTDGVLTIDHVVPTALGGSDEPSNLVACCADCNAGKSSTSPTEATVEDVSNDAMRWAAAMKLAAKSVGEKRKPGIEYVQKWIDEWRTYETGSHIYDATLADGWSPSIESFYGRGLPLDDLIHALAISMSRGHIHKTEKFRYMCGIANSMLREIADEAQSILARDEATNGS